MGCHKMAKEYKVSGRKEWSTLLNFPERSSNMRTENCPLGSSKWRVLSASACLLQLDRSALKGEQQVREC